MSPKGAKAAEKQAKNDAKAQAQLDKADEQQKARDAKDAEKAAHFARYKQLRANVGRRRFFYGLFIVLAIGVFAGSLWDILYNDSDFMLYVFGAYALIFLWGIILLFSRRKHLEEVEELWDLERLFLEDPGTGEVFQLSASKLPDLVGVEFSSPVSGQFYKMPALESKQVERVLPQGEPRTKNFKFGEVEGEVATFGKDPADITFRKTQV